MIIMTAMFLFVVIFFILIDLVPIYKEKRWKIFWIYIVFLTISCTMQILSIFNINVPSPAGPLKKMVKYIWRLPD
jgi:hypothetical protein